jgi:hypothetical protein
MRGVQLDAQRPEARGKGCGLPARQLQHGLGIVKRDPPIQDGKRAQSVVHRKREVAGAGQALYQKELGANRPVVARDDL